MTSNDVWRGRRRPRPRVRRRLTSVRLRAALGLGVVLSTLVTGTSAFWTDAATVGGTTFDAGTIDLLVNDADTVTGYATLSLDTMVPGSSTAGVLTIKNGGDAPLAYTAASTATDDDGKGLRDSLLVAVTDAAAVTGAGPSATCGGTPLPGAQASLDGPLLSASRQLAAGASETVCVQVTLDPAAAPGLQGATTEVVLIFNATSDLS